MKTVRLMAVVMVMAVAAMLFGCEEKKAETPAAAAGVEINWMGYDEGMAKAKAEGKHVMIDFYTSWCKYCKMLDETTYRDPAVVAALNSDFVAIKIDAESQDTVTVDGKKMTMAELALSLRATSFPTILFFASDGNPIALQPGYAPAEDFRNMLGFVSSGSCEKGMQYSDYLGSLKK